MNLRTVAQDIVRLSARSIVLSSGNPALLELPAGNRSSKQAMSHEEITQALFDSAPRYIASELRAGKIPPSFTLMVDGQEFKVNLAGSTEAWRITLTRVQPSEDEVEMDLGPGDSSPSEGVRTQPSTPTAAFPSTPSRGSETVGNSDRETSPPWPSDPMETSRSGFSGGSPSRSTASMNSGSSGGGRVSSAAAPASEDVEGVDSEPEINPILMRLIQDKGSDVHLTAGMPPKYRVHGSIATMTGFPVLDEARLNRMLMGIMPDRVKREFVETNDGDFAHSIKGVSRFRVNVAQDRHGTFAVIRRIPFEILSPEQLGIPKKVLDLCWLTKGLVLVTGPTGSGKSTTLATLVDFINTHRADHIITIEDPIEFVHPDNKKCLIRQREVGEHTSSFKRALRAALREDPDIVLVGEMRDLETIAIAIETAETGHLVFGTLHTSTAPSTVDRIIDQFPANQQEQIRMMLAGSLKGVIAQTLCKKNGGGRVAAYEILIGTKAVSNLIREAKTFQLFSVMQTNKAVGMQTLGESLMTHVRNRVISPEEAFMKAVDKEEMRGLFEKAGVKLRMNMLMEE